MGWAHHQIVLAKQIQCEDTESKSKKKTRANF